MRHVPVRSRRSIRSEGPCAIVPEVSAAEPIARLLLVEDDARLAANYALAFERAGLEVRVAPDVPAAREAVEARVPDVAVIDIGLGRDPDAGFALCTELRARHPRLPILFLTARDDELDIVSGLRLGADDYLVKSVSLAQLVARVRTVLRRVEALSRPIEPSATRRVGELGLDVERLEASWRGVAVELTVTEFRLIACLAERPGQVRSRAQLMSAAGLVLDERTITAHIKRVRRKFESVDADFRALATVYGLGYRWMARAGS